MIDVRPAGDPDSVECTRCGTNCALPDAGRVECGVCGQLLMVDAAASRAALARDQRMCDRCFEPRHADVHCLCGCPSEHSVRQRELIKTLVALPLLLPALALQGVHVAAGHLLRRFFGELGR